jgi:hypothetical protein
MGLSIIDPNFNREHEFKFPTVDVEYVEGGVQIPIFNTLLDAFPLSGWVTRSNNRNVSAIINY